MKMYGCLCKYMGPFDFRRVFVKGPPSLTTVRRLRAGGEAPRRGRPPQPVASGREPARLAVEEATSLCWFIVCH